MAEKSVIEAIKALRDRTGAGMMDCKHALEQNDFNVEKSVDWLREKGIAKAATRANRTAAEGKTNVSICEKCGKAVIDEVNCETDFVSASDKFIDLVKGVTSTIMQNEPKDVEEAKEMTKTLFTDAAVAVGEKLDLRRFAIIKPEGNQGVGSYIHMGGKISVVVLLEKKDDEFANQLAMHIAANNPLYLALSDVPAADREREIAVAKAEVAADPKLINKPEQVKEQIVERKADKVLSVSCLYMQNYLLDDSKTVGQVLKEKGNSVVSFVRYQLGDGIAKNPAQAE
ncbi:MAG: translation elongation factor Ts [Bacilli bacterium]|jgi:elongation factor Ts|nr:translation elongation factor Ts [Bacilli bacterium]MCH4210458.1 translation elongation factor Ts [Bacilli bacterium]MCH4228367.1 translation elongation factor Ts [Bacilli bacterium]MCH4277631.1 translation elongation factor Ts [Bacilli bacterium]MCI2054817.1 translation elongation factor Ts [Bacilli bacterium]